MGKRRGCRLYPNMYAMLIASTTFYRKSTAFKLAEQVARQAIPHMLMPMPGSPERFQEALAGQPPSNFDKLTKAQKERLTKAQPFAAQRGLLKDEVAGLFGSINKKDYMTGMKDLLMELYDCPDFSDKDTQSASHRRNARSHSGRHHPEPVRRGQRCGLGQRVADRFALLTPNRITTNGPLLRYFRKYQKLCRGPAPCMRNCPVLRPQKPACRPTSAAADVRCWPACQSYGDRCRMCDPRKDTELDERLKGVYGRLHVHAFKLATLFAALDWLDTDNEVPVVNDEHCTMRDRRESGAAAPTGYSTS